MSGVIEKYEAFLHLKITVNSPLPGNPLNIFFLVANTLFRCSRPFLKQLWGALSRVSISAVLSWLL